MRTEEIIAVMEDKRGNAISLSQLKDDVEREYISAINELRLKSAAVLRQYKADMSKIDANKLPDNVRQQIDLAKEVCETIDSINITFVNEADKLMMFVEATNTEFSVPERLVTGVQSLETALRGMAPTRSTNAQKYKNDVQGILSTLSRDTDSHYNMTGAVLLRAFMQDLVPKRANPQENLSSSVDIVARAISLGDTTSPTVTQIGSSILNGKVLPHTRKNTERVVFCIDLLEGTITNVGLWGILSHKSIRNNLELVPFVEEMHVALRELYGFSNNLYLTETTDSRNNRDAIYLKMLINRGETAKQVVDAMFPRCGFWGGGDHAQHLGAKSQNSTHPHLGADSVKMCLGNAGGMFSTQLTEMNYLGVILIIAEFLRTINLGDSAGSVFSYFPTTQLRPEEYVSAFKGASSNLINLNKGLSIQTTSGDIVTVDSLADKKQELIVDKEFVLSTIRQTEFVDKQFIREDLNPLNNKRNPNCTSNKFKVMPTEFDYDNEMYMFEVTAFDIDYDNEYPEKHLTEQIINTSRGIFVLQNAQDNRFSPWQRYLLNKGYSLENVRNTSVEYDSDDEEATFYCDALENDGYFHAVEVSDIWENVSLTEEFLRYSEFARQEIYGDVIEKLYNNSEAVTLTIGSSQFMPDKTDGELLRRIKGTIVDSTPSQYTGRLRSCLGELVDTHTVDRAEFIKLSGSIVSITNMITSKLIEINREHQSNDFVAFYGWIAPFYVYQFDEEHNLHKFVPVQNDLDQVAEATLQFLNYKFPSGTQVLSGTGIYTKGYTGIMILNYEGIALTILGGKCNICRVQEISPNSAEQLYGATSKQELNVAMRDLNATPKNVEIYRRSLYATLANDYIATQTGKLYIFTAEAVEVVKQTNPLIRATAKWVNLAAHVYTDFNDIFGESELVVNIPTRYHIQTRRDSQSLMDSIRNDETLFISPEVDAFHNGLDRLVKYPSIHTSGSVKFKDDDRFRDPNVLKNLAESALSSLRFHSFEENKTGMSNPRTVAVFETLVEMAKDAIIECVEEFNTFGTVFTFNNEKTRRRNAFMLDDSKLGVSSTRMPYEAVHYNGNTEYNRQIKPYVGFHPTGAEIPTHLTRAVEALTTLIPDGVMFDDGKLSPVLFNEHITYLQSNIGGVTTDYLVGVSKGGIRFRDSRLDIERFPLFTATQTLGSDKYYDALFVQGDAVNKQNGQLKVLIKLLFAFNKAGIDTSTLKQTIRAHIKELVAVYLEGNNTGLVNGCVYSPVGRVMLDSHTASLLGIVIKQSTSAQLEYFRNTITTDLLMAGTMLGRFQTNLPVIAHKSDIALAYRGQYSSYTLFLNEDIQDSLSDRDTFRALLKTLNATGEKKAEKINKAFAEIKSNYTPVTRNTQDMSLENYITYKNDYHTLLEIPELILKGGK